MTLPAATPDLAELNRMMARFAPVELKVDTSHLSKGDQQALKKLIEAAKVIDEIFLQQRWYEGPAVRIRLEIDKTPLGKARLRYFDINKGPFSELDGLTAFLPNVPAKKPLGAGFYDEQMTTQEFEAWVKTLPAGQQTEARGFFSVIRREKDGKLAMTPYREEYRYFLDNAAKQLNEAAALTTNATLKEFLTLRAKAFLSDDYYASDVAWMKLDAPVEVTIGPYETYNDELFGYKAAFEAYITLRDEAETARMKNFADHIQAIENNLPLDAKYKNPKLGK